MPETLDQNGADSAASPRAEVRLSGNPVSRGIAIGTVQILHGAERQFFKRNINPPDTAAEVERFRRSLLSSRRQLASLAEADGKAGNLHDILCTQMMMLDDPDLTRQIDACIRDEGVNAEWAAMTVMSAMSAKLRSLADDGLRERYVDVDDVSERILAALTGGGTAFGRLPEGSVIVASELRPSSLAALAGAGVRGIVTEHGGWTSHTFILAREMGVPAVTGVRDLLRQARTGQLGVVDGDRGELVLNPAKKDLDGISSHPRTSSPHPTKNQTTDGLKTLDGRQITIKANIDFPSYYSRALELGAAGIGLYRSEFLLDHFKGLPREDEQYAAYREILDLAGEAGANIRTFDVGLRRLPEDIPYRERNAALGLRAIRLSLSHPKEFRVQLRALLRASAGRKLSITLPMISGVGEIRDARRILEEERANLVADGIEHGEPVLGAMVEVPSTIFIIEEVVEESDCICLGTNDLVQYLLAVDRDNELVASWFNTLHPSVIRAVRKVVEACSNACKPLTVCGEMAGSPYYGPVLIGLGATELSMNVTAIARVREVVSSIKFADAIKLAAAVGAAATSEEAESILLDHIEAKWRHLYPDRVSS